MPDPKRLNASLRECRDELYLTQRVLAERLGIATETYRAWESGRRVVPVKILGQARALAGYPDDRALLPLHKLAE
jgi:DNA-binding transcriptional regulator YiaG